MCWCALNPLVSTFHKTLMIAKEFSVFGQELHCISSLNQYGNLSCPQQQTSKQCLSKPAISWGTSLERYGPLQLDKSLAALIHWVQCGLPKPKCKPTGRWWLMYHYYDFFPSLWALALSSSRKPRAAACRWMSLALWQPSRKIRSSSCKAWCKTQQYNRKGCMKTTEYKQHLHILYVCIHTQ